MHIRHLQTLCCSSWMLAKSVWVTFVSPVLLFPWMASSISRTGMCWKWKVCVALPSSQSLLHCHGLSHHILHFFYAQRLLQHSIWTFSDCTKCLGRSTKDFVVHARWCPSTSNAWGLSFFSWNILMVTSLPWVIAVIWEVTWIYLPI